MKTAFTAKFLLYSLLLVLVFFPLGAAAMESEDCLGCHEDIETVGEELFINAAVFDVTAHAELGCSACHESVTDEHPDDGLEVSKAACLDCHDEIGEQYAKTAHVEYAACGDCHNPHQVRGLNEVSGYDLNQQCASCHETDDVVSSHSEWLTQADRHIAKLPCISCHTDSEDYVIVLYMTQRESKAVMGDFELSTYQDLVALAKQEDVKSLIDLDNDNKISLAELSTFNFDSTYRSMRLQATLTPADVSHTVETLDSRWDCSFCHVSGTERMQTSFLALPTSEGTYQRIEVERGAVLNALNGPPDFYMMGATRSTLMSILGLLIVIGGTLLPIGHGSLRFLTRKNRMGKGE